jgi:xanthine/CO dehydrogenase XdhC/CoxF family maturation factor
MGIVPAGCVEAELIDQAQGVIHDGRPRLLQLHVSDPDAWQCGLPCGGDLEVFIERVE